MTIRDLVEHSLFVKNMEIVVRENGGGLWLYGFRIGKDAKIYPYEACAEHREDRGQFGTDGCKLKEGEVVDVKRWNWQTKPIKVMCIDPKKAPKEILDLEVKEYQPRHIPSLHGEALTHNDFDLEIDCYPPEQQEKLAMYSETKELEQKDDDQLAGQMSIEDFID